MASYLPEAIERYARTGWSESTVDQFFRTEARNFLTAEIIQKYERKKFNPELLKAITPMNVHQSRKDEVLRGLKEESGSSVEVNWTANLKGIPSEAVRYDVTGTITIDVPYVIPVIFHLSLLNVDITVEISKSPYSQGEHYDNPATIKIASVKAKLRERSQDTYVAIPNNIGWSAGEEKVFPDLESLVGAIRDAAIKIINTYFI